EDGIRDFHVTGVQTCALPISVLDELATELVSSGTELPEDADGYERGAAVLASALMAVPADEPGAAHETVDTAAVTAFEESELIRLEQIGRASCRERV